MSEHILIIEDDKRLAELCCDYLRHHGYRVDQHARGDDAEAIIYELNPDLLILDVMLPGKSGFDVCRAVRNRFAGRILIMTASDDEIDEIVGLEIGADDYLSKPIEPRLLLAHIRALLRRNKPREGDQATSSPAVAQHDSSANQSQPTQLTFGDLRIDKSNRRVMLKEKLLDFTTAEFDLLWLLASHAGQVLSRDDILGALRGIDFDGLDRSIDARISRLRKKLSENPDQPLLIKTVRGKGYLFLRESAPLQ